MFENVNDAVVKAYVHTTNAMVNFKNNEKGVTAVEYAIVVAGVAAVAALIFGRDGTVNKLLTGIFTNVTTSVDANFAAPAVAAGGTN